jgi:hypothetical protein
VLPIALKDLKPFHQELIGYVVNLQGKRRPTYTHARRTWGLDKNEFDLNLHAAFSAVRDSLKRRGIRQLADLEMR